MTINNKELLDNNITYTMFNKHDLYGVRAIKGIFNTLNVDSDYINIIKSYDLISIGIFGNSKDKPLLFHKSFRNNRIPRLISFTNIYIYIIV